MLPRKITDKETPEVVSKSESGADLISAQLREGSQILYTPLINVWLTPKVNKGGLHKAVNPFREMWWYDLWLYPLFTLANTEKELKNIKAKLQSASSTESSTKETIPLVVWVRILS